MENSRIQDRGVQEETLWLRGLVDRPRGRALGLFAVSGSVEQPEIGRAVIGAASSRAPATRPPGPTKEDRRRYPWRAARTPEGAS